MDGLAFNAGGILYSFAVANQTLYTLDQVAGTPITTIPTTLPAGQQFGGMAFHPITGTLYVAVSTGGAGSISKLYTLDPATGTATMIGNIGFPEVAGLSFYVPPGVTITPTTVSAVEGGATAAYTVVLNAFPAANVTITATPDAQETVAPAVLTFTPLNWNVPQTVTVTAFNHGVYMPPHVGTIMQTAASADPLYNGIAVPSVTVNITSSLPPPSGGGGASSPGGAGEGSFAGSSDPASQGGSEGGFGFGGSHLAAATALSRPVLAGPYLPPPGVGNTLAPASFTAAPPPGSCLRVYNVSGQVRGKATGQQAKSGPASALGWAVLAALALVGTVALTKKVLSVGSAGT